MTTPPAPTPTAPGRDDGTQAAAQGSMPRRTLLYAAATVVVLAVFACTVFVNSIPANVLSTERTTVTDVSRALSPQGWSFFTRDAREETYRAWAQVDGEWRVLAPGGGASPSYGFGIARTARLIDSDVSFIAEQAAADVADAVPAGDGGERVGTDEERTGLREGDPTDLRDEDPADDVAALPASGREGGGMEELTTRGWHDCGTAPVADCLAQVEDVGVVTYRPVTDELCGRLGIVRSEPVPWAFGTLTRETRKKAVVVDARCEEVVG